MAKNKLHGLFVWKKSGNMGDKFPLPVRTTSIGAETKKPLWNKGFLWIKTDAAMESEKEIWAKNSPYGDLAINLGGEEIGKLSDFFVNRIAFQKECDAFVSTMPVPCAMTYFQGKDVYLFVDCPMSGVLTEMNPSNGEKSEFPAWIIPFSENHPDKYLSGDGEYDVEAMHKWTIFYLHEEGDQDG